MSRTAPDEACAPRGASSLFDLPPRLEHAHICKQVERRQQINGPHSELFVFLMKKESNENVGDVVSTPLELHDFMRVLEQGSGPGRLRDCEFAHDSEPA